MRMQRFAAMATFALVIVLWALVGVVWMAGNLGPVWEFIAFGLWLFTFAVVGLLIAFRRPGNAIAWLCLGFALVWGAQLAGDAVLRYEMANPGLISRPELLAVVADQVWIPGVGLIGFMLLLYPDGKLPSPRWRPLVWVLWITMALVMAYGLTRPGRFTDWNFTNPLGVAWVGHLVVVDYALVLVLALSLVASAASVVFRFRRSTGPERLQLKWLVAAGIVSATSYALLFVDDGLPWILTWTTIPVAIGIAILRYRLYDIDRLVSRTVAYVVVTGILVAIFLGAVFVFQLVLPAEGDLAVAASTLAVAAAFNPLRRRVQGFVDRRFNRSRYDAGRTVDTFVRRLRGATDATALADQLCDTTVSVMEPAHVSLWLRRKP